MYLYNMMTLTILLYVHRGRESEETVDRRQNNGSVKAVSPRHCPAISALRNCCFNCRAWAESHGQCPLHCCCGTTQSERNPTFAAQLYLPAHDLFWANLRVQLHLPPLDLAWNPVCNIYNMMMMMTAFI